MMATFKNNRWFIAVLTSVSLLVWGVIVYQIIWGVSYQPELKSYSGNTDKNADKKSIPPGYDSSLFHETAHLRDPFQRKVKIEKAKPVRQKKPVQVVVQIAPPEMKYIGYLKDTEGPLALLELPQGETSISREGEIVQTFKIKSISKESVKLIKDGQDFVLPLHQ